MAIPTDFKGITPVAGVTTTFPIPNAGGIYGMDAGGTLTPKAFSLTSGVVVLLTQTVTDADLVIAMRTFIRRYGDGKHSAGGWPAQATLQVSPAVQITA